MSIKLSKVQHLKRRYFYKRENVREINVMDTNDRASNGGFSSFLRQYQLIIFFVLALAVSIGFALVAVMIGDTNITFMTVFTPTLIAIALTALVSGKAGLRELLVKQTIQRVNFRWIVISLITFPLIAAIAIGFHSLFGGPALALRKTELVATNDFYSADIFWGRIWLARLCSPQTTTKI